MKPVLRTPSDDPGDDWDICWQELEERLGYDIDDDDLPQLQRLHDLTGHALMNADVTKNPEKYPEAQ